MDCQWMLQPFDIGQFSPLASYYSTNLDAPSPCYHLQNDGLGREANEKLDDFFIQIKHKCDGITVAEMKSQGKDVSLPRPQPCREL